MVPTPVGNMDDMTPRAIDVLRKVDLILAEDTRTSSVLLKHFDIKNTIQSHHKFNEHSSIESLVAKMEDGTNIALITDAGTPGISDPGFLLSRECRRKNIPVETLPGPTAFIPALVNSGLPCDRFSFEGFLPQKSGRASTLSRIASDERTTVIYESPLRLVRTLRQLIEVCGADREASVSREISKLHEETVRGTLGEILEYFSEKMPKGEIVIVLAGQTTRKKDNVHKNKYKNENTEN